MRAMALAAPALALSVALPVAVGALPAQAIVPADVNLAPGPISSVVSVSPDVFYDEATSTYYLFTTGPGTGGPPSPGSPSVGVFSSTDGTSWVAVPGASTPIGTYADPSVIAMGDGTYRMYYAYRASMSTGPGSACSGKQLRYATSTDLVRWNAQPGVLLEDLGCGVPNVVRVGEGDYRLYYVRGGSGFAHGTYMATSPDGLAWTPTDTLLTPTDMVDPSVVRLADGSWLMLTADFPARKSSRPFFQKLYAGTSSDGVEWDFDATAPLYRAPAGEGAFDPDAVVLPDGSVRAWWAQGSSPDTARVVVGDLTIASTPTPAAPSKPTVRANAQGITVAWEYPVGAPRPQAYVVQVKSGKGWRDAARVDRTRAQVSWSKTGVKKGRTASVRVVAYVGDASAASAATRVTRPR